MALEAVIFDCDGTLVDSERIGLQVLIEYAAEFGIALSLQQALTDYKGRYMRDTVAALGALRGSALPPEFIPELRRRMALAFSAQLRPIDGAAALLDRLQLPCCLASSGPREKIEHTLSVTGLRRHFSDARIFSGYEVGSWKPDPGLFLHAAAAMGVPPACCAVVEDSLPGVAAGVAAGIRVFALQTDAPDARLPAAATVVSSLGELGELLGCTIAPVRGEAKSS